jgi:hypothetical protein
MANHNLGPGETGVTKAPDGKEHAAWLEMGRINIPAEPAQVLAFDRRIFGIPALA